VGWRPSITRHLLTLGGDVHRSSLAHRIMHITAPRPAGIRPWAGTAIGSGQEVVQWPTVTLARKRQNCGYDQGTGSGVFQVGQRGAGLNERQPAVPVACLHIRSRLPTRALLSRGDDACNPERAGRLQQPPPEPLTTCRQAPQECRAPPAWTAYLQI
jgi:hypothetical protein